MAISLEPQQHFSMAGVRLQWFKALTRSSMTLEEVTGLCASTFSSIKMGITASLDVAI